MDKAYVPRTQKGLFGNYVAWVLALVVVFGVIGIGLWAFGVFTAPLAGRGGAFKQQQSANNRIFAQQAFEQANADIEGYVQKIALAKAAYKAQPTDVNQTNLQGLQQQCVNTVQQYNADARKYLLRDFRSADLPSRQDPAQCG